jgi:hypothetical protein
LSGCHTGGKGCRTDSKMIATVRHACDIGEGRPVCEPDRVDIGDHLT